MKAAIVENRAIFTDTLFKASVTYFEHTDNVRTPYIRVYTNDDNYEDVAEIRNIFKKEQINFVANDSRHRCILSLAILPNLFAFINFIMFEVRKNPALLDVSKLD